MVGLVVEVLAAVPGGRKEDLVVLEIRRLQDDPRPVGKCERGRPERGIGSLGKQLTRLRLTVQQLRIDLDPAIWLDLGLQHLAHHAPQRGVGGASHGRRGDHHKWLAARLLEDYPRVVVDSLQRATWDELFDALVLPRNARHGLVGKKMTTKLVGERAGLRLVSLRGRLGVPVHHVALGRVELLDGEPESARPLDLGRQQACRLNRILPGNGSAGDKRLVATNDRRPLCLRGQEGTYWPVGELVQPHAEHPVDQLVFEQRLVGANGGQRGRRPQVLGEVDVAGGQLGLRDDERVKRRPRRDLEARRSGPRVGDRRHIGEQRLDAAFDLGDVDITHDNHGLEIGAVPVAIEPAQHVGRHRTQTAFGADRESGGVAAPVEHPQQHLPPYPLLGGVAAAQFRQHDTTLGLDIRIGEQGVAGPLPQDREASLEYLAIAHGNREHVDRLVVPSGRVEIAAEPHPH